MSAHKGFSLVELTLVMFIIGLMLGGLLVPLATQTEARQRNETLQQLEQIREALIGFAIINGRLPCYTTQSDPTSAGYGMEDSPCNPAGLTSDGILPWKTLGMETGFDPWGVQRISSTDPWTGFWRYRVHPNFVTTISLSSSPFSSNKLCIVDAGGNLVVSTSETPVALVYSTGANQTENGQNASYEATSVSTDCVNNSPILYQGGPASGDFDDITMWLTRPLLFNRMVTANRLP